MLIKFKSFFSKFFQRLSEPLFIFRLSCVILVTDCLIFWFLGSINPLQLLNPLKFLKSSSVDDREFLKLYYPSSLELKQNGKGKNTEELILVQQKVYQLSEEDSKDRDHRLAQNAWYILQELSLSPSNLKIKRVFKNIDLIKSLWVQKKTLIVHLNSNIWQQYNKKKQRLIKKSILKSVTENISHLKRVTWVSS